MRLAFLLLLISALFGSSAHGADPWDIRNESKASFIHRAAENDVGAMLGLAMFEAFPNTKEGLTYFAQWAPHLADAGSADPDTLLALAQIYAANSEKFVRPVATVGPLFETLIRQGNTQAAVEYIDFLKAHDQRRKYLTVFEANLNVFDKAQLDLMAEDAYQELYRGNDAFMLDKLKGEYARRKLLPAYSIYMADYARHDATDADQARVIEALLKTRDASLITAFARHVYNVDQNHALGLSLAEKAYAVDDTEQETLLRLANMYRNIGRTEEAYALYRRNAELHRDIPSLIALLAHFASRQEAARFEATVARLKQTKKGMHALATYFFDTDAFSKANALLAPLAKAGDEDARYLLIVRNFDHDRPRAEAGEATVSAHWYDALLKDDNRLAAKTFFTRASQDRAAQGLRPKFIAWREDGLAKGSLDAQFFELVRLERKREKISPAFESTLLASGDARVVLKLAAMSIRRSAREGQDVNKGLALYESLADKGDVRAINALADFYSTTDEAGLRDIPKGLAYAERAAELGDEIATDRCASLYLCLWCHFPKDRNYESFKAFEEHIDYAKAFTYANQLVELHRPKGAVFLGFMYDHGNGVAQDVQQAIAHYQNGLTARERSVAYYRLGYFAEMGLGMPKDNQKAFDWYLRSMKARPLRDVAARLAAMYEHGNEAVEPDLKKAWRYYRELEMMEDAQRVKERMDALGGLAS